MGPLGFHLLFKFQVFFAFPVSGSEAVSIRNLRREGRHASACSNFSVVRSAFRLACVSLLSLASGGSSSAVNSSLEGFSAQRLRLLSAPPVPRLLQPHGNADSIGFRAGVSGFCALSAQNPFLPLMCQPPKEQVLRDHARSHAAEHPLKTASARKCPGRKIPVPLYNRCYFRQQVPIRKFSPAVLLPAWPAKGPPPSEAGPPADGFLKHREKGHPLPGAGQNPARPAAASCVPPYGNPAPASGHLSVFSEIPRHVPLSSPPVMFNKLHFLTPLSPPLHRAWSLRRCTAKYPSGSDPQMG